MKFNLICHIALILLFVTKIQSQAITISLENKELAANNLSWSFDLVATANSNYSSPNDNNWTAMSVRFDFAIGSNNITGGNISINPTYALNGSIITSVPGTPPAGSTELGISVTRNGQSDLIIGSGITLGTFTVNFATPVDGSNVVTPRANTTSSGSFWSNSISGSRPFNLPAAFPLPIKLSSFSAVKDGDRSARLDWTSASEVNSAYFGIERSTDGINWQAIDRVAAAGNSSSNLDYQYYDRNLPISRSNDHIFYYRLQLVDLDGQYKYSDVRGVNFEGIATTDVISLYPNPTTSLVNIDLRDMDIEQGSIHLTVVDMAGRLILNKTINGNGIEPIDVSRYDAGSYQVLVTQGSQQHQKRFIKAN